MVQSMQFLVVLCLLYAPAAFALTTSNTTSNATVTTTTALPTVTPTQAPKGNSVGDFINGNSWLATPIVAFIGWFCTWILGAIQARRKGLDHRRIADLRYTGIIKRTCAAAFLADEYNGHPRQVIGFVCMDPGFATSLQDFSGCRAGWFDFTSWAIQVGAMFYSIFLAVYVWSQDNEVQRSSPYVQFSLLLAVLNINRGTWALAVCGSFYPGTDKQRMKWLMGTTVIALCIDWIFISRSLLMAWHLNLVVDLNNRTGFHFAQRVLGILAWVLPAVEGGIFFAGLLAGYRRIEHIGSWFILFIPAAIWLALGPLFIIAVSVLLHFRSV